MIAQKQKEHTIEKTYKELYIEILKVNKEIGLRFQDYISTHLSKISQISSDVLNEDKFNQVDTTIGNCIKDIREICDDYDLSDKEIDDAIKANLSEVLEDKD